MNARKRFIPRDRDKSIRTVFDSTDVFLELRLDPHTYFYPLLDWQYRGEYCEEDGITIEQFEKEKKLSIKLDKMFRSKKYKKIFEETLKYNIANFLNQIEREAKIQFEDGESLDYKVSKREDEIFKLLEMEGPGILRHKAVLKKIRKWCIEKELKKIEILAAALKNYAKKTFGSTPFSYFQEKYFVAFEYPYLQNQLKKLKKDITFHEKKIKDIKEFEKFIVNKWSDREFTDELQWFRRLEKIAKKEERKTSIDMIAFIKKHAPRDLALMIFADLIHKSPATVDKIIRKSEEIMKNVVNPSR